MILQYSRLLYRMHTEHELLSSEKPFSLAKQVAPGSSKL